jgi:hypothetical protein
MAPPSSTRVIPPAAAVAEPSSNGTDELYDAATRGDLGQLIRQLPAAIQARFESKQRGIQLPAKEKHRLRFLNEVADLSARLLEPGRAETERAWALVARRGYGGGMARAELVAIDKTFALIQRVAATAMRSPKPSDYVRLLSRPGVDIERLVSTMGFFAGDRVVRMRRLDMEQRRVALAMERLARQGSSSALRGLLSYIVDRIPEPSSGLRPYDSDWRVLHAFDLAAGMVSDRGALARLLRRDHATLIKDQAFFQVDEMAERVGKARDDEAMQRHTHQFLVSCGIYQLRGGQLLRFGKMFKEGPIEGYVVLKPERLRAYGYEALTSAHIDDPTALLASEKEHTIQHELQHMFDKIIYVESALRTMEDGTGETRSNLLGMEYRARLAEMAFTHDLGLVEDAMGEVRDSIAAQDGDRVEMGIRVEADRLVYERMGRTKRGAALRRLARRLLDLAYRQAYGLTYSQIVEPFALTGC